MRGKVPAEETRFSCPVVEPVIAGAVSHRVSVGGEMCTERVQDGLQLIITEIVPLHWCKGTISTQTHLQSFMHQQ